MLAALHPVVAPLASRFIHGAVEVIIPLQTW